MSIIEAQPGEEIGVTIELDVTDTISVVGAVMRLTYGPVDRCWQVVVAVSDSVEGSAGDVVTTDVLNDWFDCPTAAENRMRDAAHTVFRCLADLNGVTPGVVA